MKKTLFGFSLVVAAALQMQAASITDINIQSTGVAYAGPGGAFSMFAGTPIQVVYESDPTANGSGVFSLNTMAMSSSIVGNTISYTGAGIIALSSTLGDFNASLVSLSMTLNAGGGFEGVGVFNSIVESINGDFSNVGGIANFGFSFNGTATSWSSSFGGVGSAILSAQSPGTPGTSVPDGGLTLAMLGLGVLSLGAGYRKITR